MIIRDERTRMCKKSPPVGQKLADRDERTSKSPANGQNSFYLRELMSGKFCIPSEQILQLEIIGQGILYVVLTLSFDLRGVWDCLQS